MSPLPPVLRRSFAMIAALALLGITGCKDKSQETRPSGPSQVGSPRAMPAPAGADIIALLDGLAVGDKVAGASVTAIGAVDARGTIPIVLEQGGDVSVIVIAALTETPAPPASTKSYSVFFEAFDHRNQLPGQQATEAVRQIAARLKKTEDKQPVPAGLKPLSRATIPA